MVVKTMIEILDNCSKVRTEKISWNSYYFSYRDGRMGFYAGNVNIIYLLNNKIYIGGGTICESDEYRLNKELVSKEVRHIKFGLSPKFICQIPIKDVEDFKKLLYYEGNKVKGLKISTSYKDFLQNTVPQHLSDCNEEKYHQYELKSVRYHVNKRGGIFVNLHFDNYMDFDEHAEYFIDDDAQKVIKQLGNWAYEDEEVDCDPQKVYRCIIV